MTDPIADMLTRIRNAQMAKKAEVVIPFSKLKLGIAEILKQNGYLGKIVENKENHELKIDLKYTQDKLPAIKSIKRVSKPGCKVYATKDTIPKVLNGFGLAVMSTSKGLMTGKQAKKTGLGGEVICEIY
jgi:small subunit ribosomal protein S8